MRMEVTYKCRLLGLSLLLALADFAHRDRYITFLPRSLWITHSLFELSWQLISRVRPARSDDVCVMLDWASVH